MQMISTGSSRDLLGIFASDPVRCVDQVPVRMIRFLDVVDQMSWFQVALVVGISTTSQCQRVVDAEAHGMWVAQREVDGCIAQGARHGSACLDLGYGLAPAMTSRSYELIMVCEHNTQCAHRVHDIR